MNNDETKPTPKKSATPGSKKVFDVMRPGKALASPTSRPVISTHKAKIKDDMFVPGADTRLAGNPQDEDKNMMTHKDPKKKLDVPTSEEAKPEAQQPAAVDQKPAEQESEAPSEQTAPVMPANFPEEEKPVTAAMEDTTEPAAPVFEEPAHTEDVALVPETPAADTPVPDVTPEEDEQIASVVDSVQYEPTDEFDRKRDGGEPAQPASDSGYEPNKALSNDDIMAATNAPVLDQAFVSHHKGRTKWWEWLAIIVMIILLAVVALNFLIDAEVIKTNLDVPHTDLIK